MKARLALVSVLLLIFATGCREQKTTEKAAQPSPWNLAMETAPAEPISGKPVTFNLKVTDRTSGQPVAGAHVQASLVMPTMDMGKNEFALNDKGAGEYSGTGTFTMAGPWNVVVEVKKDNQEAQQTFQVVAKAD